MPLSVDWANKVVLADASITDIVAFRDDIRALEESASGMLHPAIITYKRVALGGGAYFHAVDFINGYTLKFPSAGSYTIVGNVNATIVAVPGVYVERKTSAAFSSLAGSGGGATAEDIRNALGPELALIRLIPALL
jgi:hypothetical protein